MLTNDTLLLLSNHKVHVNNRGSRTVRNARVERDALGSLRGFCMRRLGQRLRLSIAHDRAPPQCMRAGLYTCAVMNVASTAAVLVGDETASAQEARSWRPFWAGLAA